MAEIAEEVERLALRGPLPVDASSQPLGTAWLPEHGRGIDLAAHGYVEKEYLVSGVAATWTWDAQLRAEPSGRARFTTRMLVRRPADPARFSGGVQLEPHHPDEDRALSWAMIAPWIVRRGHAHVGVTQEPATVPDLIAWDPQRYGELSIPEPTMRWEILGQVAAAIRAGAVTGLEAVRRVVLSGWSMTGTFCRTFLGEGFHERCRVDSAPAIDGYVICISSGGAGRAGYGTLRPGTQIPLDDPRRTIGAHGVPAVELLSEGESETHRDVLRSDGDGADDLYRLYQVAGTGHVVTGVPSLTTNRLQMEQRGAAPLPREINERPSDARMDLVARAVFDAADRWIDAGTPPPRAARFDYGDHGDAGPRGHMPESLPLVRDADGNAVGGVRTPWVEVPTAAYLPHSTPRPGRCLPAPHAPYANPALLADLIAHMEPFEMAELKRRYGNSEAYMERFERCARTLSAAGWLLEEDLPELLATREAGCGRW